MMKKMKILASFEAFFLFVYVFYIYTNHCGCDLAFQIYRHIFTGPSSALNLNSRGPHKTKAKKFKLTKVTGCTIAYASVQVSDFDFYQYFSHLLTKVYIALSSMSQ